MKIKIGRFQWNSRIEHRRMAVLFGVAFIALAAGISVLVGIVRLPSVTPGVRETERGVLSIAHPGQKGGSGILDEEARLLDPAPLFLPTEHNYTQSGFASVTHREPTQAFQDYPPSYAYSDESFTIRFPDPAPIPSQPVEALGYGRTQTPYATLGRAAQPAAPLPGRMAYVEVVNPKTTQTLFTVSIPRPDSQTEGLPGPLASGGLWPPLELLVPVGITGFAAPPALMNDSKDPDVSGLVQYFAHYLNKTLHIDARPELVPGLYLFRIGP